MTADLKTLGVLEKCSHILELFTETPFQFSFSEIIERTHFSASSVHRVLAQMVELGFLNRSPKGKIYSLGPKMMRLAHANLAARNLEAVLEPDIRAVCQMTSETAFTVRLRGKRVEFVSVLLPEGLNDPVIHPGHGERPFNACSSAKAIAAFQSPSFIDRVLGLPMEKYTKNTLTSAAELRHEYDAVRSKGYAVSDEEMDLGVSSLSCPILIKGLGVIYAIGTIGFKSRRSEVMTDRICATLKERSTLISQKFASSSFTIGA